MAKRRHRRGDDLRRRVETRDPKRTYLVLCEGTKTECDYLQALKDLPEVRLVAEVDLRVHKKGSGAVPLTLVETAISLKLQNGDIDEYWCLYDVEAPDPHPNLDRARDLAQAHQIRTAVSNPCFEIWLLLHFKAHTRWESTEDATKLREQEDGSTGKEVDGALYMPERWTAVANARDLRDKHIDDQTVFPHDNPSSGVFELLEAVEGRTS